MAIPITFPCAFVFPLCHSTSPHFSTPTHPFSLSPPLLLQPMTGHLHPKKSKAITVTFKAEEPVVMKEEPVIVALTQITLNDPQVWNWIFLPCPVQSLRSIQYRHKKPCPSLGHATLFYHIMTKKNLHKLFCLLDVVNYVTIKKRSLNLL